MIHGPRVGRMFYSKDKFISGNALTSKAENDDEA